MALQPQRSEKEQHITFLKSRQTRLIYLFLLVSILPLLVVGWINLRQTRLALQQQSFDSLADVSDLKAEQIDVFFRWISEDITLMSKSPVVVQALQDFSVDQDLYDIRLLGYLTQPDKIDSGKNTAFDAAHRRYHPVFSEIVKTKGYDDIYLVTSAGDIMYNYDKGTDFATNLLTGDYHNTHLAQLFNELYASTNNKVKITDFVLYGPSDGAAASFIGAPVFADGKNIGILVFQLPLSRINELMQTGADVIGKNGEIYLVGPDNLMRTDSQLSQVSTILQQKVDNLAVRQALAGKSGQTELIGYRGQPTLAVYRPVNFGEQTWALLAEISQTEAFTLTDTLRNSALSTISLAMLAVALVGFFVARQLNRPIANLTETAMAIAAGNLDVRTAVHRDDEIGLLAESFNSMADQFKEVINTLEERVLERTQQVETLIEIGQQLAGILELDELLHQVVARLKERFNYDNVHIYLPEGENNILIMVEGDGQVGLQMKRQGYSIAMASPRSVVARSAREGQTILIDDVRQIPYWTPHPLLPNTRAELAVPIIFATEIVGVLDVQSEKTGRFTDIDRLTLESLANQIATAIRNARLFSETQNALSDAHRLQRMYASQSWGQLSGSTRTNNYEYRKSYLPALDQITTPEALTALQQRRTVTFAANMQRSDAVEQFIPQEFDSSTDTDRPDDTKIEYSVAATPLKLHDEIIGVLGIHDNNPKRVWTDDEIALIEAVSEQMSLAIENARLFELTQRDAWRNRVVSETTAQVWASGEINAVMQAAVAQLADKLQATEVVIHLGPDTELTEGGDHA